MDSEWFGPESEFDNVDKLRKYLRDLKAIAETDGLKYLEQVCKARYTASMASIAAQPLSSLDEALAQEHAKGVAIAHLMFETLVPTLIKDFEDRIQHLIDSQPEEDDG